MATFTEIFNTLSAIAILLIGAGSLLLLCMHVAYRNESNVMLDTVSKQSLWIGMVLALFAIGGSLIYSGLIGYAPCTLCWWQRIFIYPQVVLYGMALWNQDKTVFRYTLVLSLIGLVFSLYHNYLDWGGSTLIACDSSVSCTMRYVNEFGFVTIPLMSLITLISLAIVGYIGMKRNRA